MAFTVKNAALMNEAMVEMAEFINDLEKDSDRSAAIVGAVILESQIYDVAKILGDADFSFGRRRPSFYDLIEWAQKRQLLSESHAHDLQIIRGIRNAFAHLRIAKLRFDDERISLEVSKLRFASGLEGYEQLPARCQFEETVRQIGVDLLALLGAAVPPNSRPSFESLTGMKLRESASEEFQDLNHPEPTLVAED